MFPMLNNYRKLRLLLQALPLALVLFLLLPAMGLAHAILLKSDPARDAVLTSAPAQVRMWFSENLNPATSTSTVVDTQRNRVDVNGGLVIPTNTLEMDVSLKPNLAPGVYVVIWRTQSADDGHVLSGSFLFSIANPDGTVPRSSGQLPDQSLLGGTSTGQASGQLDDPTLFSLAMVTLVELGVVFWVGGQIWHAFILDLSPEGNSQQGEIEQQSRRRFEQRFSLPILRVLFLTNIGVLLGQALSLTGGRWDLIFSPTLLAGLLTSGRFGAFWVMREAVITLAMALGAYPMLARRRSQRSDEVLNWGNLLLGLALLIATTLSGHAAAVSGTTGVFAVLVDWLHLLAASLWVGGMFYLALVYLPILKGLASIERTRSLLNILPRFSPYAIVGVVIMALSGPFNATVHMTAWSQLYTTAYGRALLVKIVCVLGLLITSAIHLFLLRPGLARDYKKYVEGSTRGTASACPPSDVMDTTDTLKRSLRENSKVADAALANKALEQRMARQTNRLTSVLRWEPLLGVAVLLCTGLLNVFAGTLLPANANQPATSQPVTGQQTTGQAKPFTTTVQTDDKKFTINLTVSPNRFGPNLFTVSVKDSSGKLDTNVGVSLYNRMLDMDMGTDSLNLQPDGKGHFSANGDLNMAGNWEIRIQIRTPDNTLHETKVRLATGQ